MNRNQRYLKKMNRNQRYLIKKIYFAPRENVDGMRTKQKAGKPHK